MNTLKYSRQTEEDVKFGSIFQIIRRHRAVALSVVLGCTALAAILSFVLPKKYQAEAQMIWNERSQTYSNDPNDYNKPQVTIDTMIGLAQSDFMIYRTAVWIDNNGGLTDKENSDISNYDYKVDNPKASNILAVTATAKTRKEAVVLANGFCNAFIEYNREIAQEDLQKTCTALKAQAAAALQQLDDAQARQQNLQGQTGIVDVTLQDQALVTRMANLSGAIDGLRQDVASSQAKVDELETELQGVDAEIGNHGIRDDAGIALLSQELTQAQVDLADARQRYTSKFPGMLAPMEAKVEDLQRRLAAAIKLSLNINSPSLTAQANLTTSLQDAKAELQSNVASLSSLLATQQEVRSELTSAPAQRLENDKVQQNVDVDRALYTSVKSSLTSTQLLLAHVNGDVELTDAATIPQDYSYPNPMIFIPLGFVAGLGLAAMIIFNMERKDTRIHSLERLALNLPAQPIGGLEHLTPKNKTLTVARNNALPEPITAYSVAVANLDLLWSRLHNLSGNGRHTILVTSAVAGEGKTTTSCYLAKLFARSGRSVILVDADFGNPSLKSVFGINVDAGLYEIMHNGADVLDAVHSTDVENLRVIMQSASSRISQAPELLSPQKVRNLVSHLAQLAEIVIFDTSPMTASSDGLQFAMHVDTIVHVIGLGVVKEPALNQAAVGLKLARPNTYVTFINRLEKGQGYYSPYGYYAQTPMPLESEETGRLLLSGPQRSVPFPDEKL